MRNQKGQAIIEYVLLLFVIVTTLTAILLAVSDSTKKFTQNYFGAYFTCLLETGELPALGSDSDPNSECDDSYQPFTLAVGRPPVNTDAESNNSNSDSTSGNRDESGDSAARDNASSGNSEAAGPSSTGGSFADSGGRSAKIPLSKSDKILGKEDGPGEGAKFNNFQQEFGENGTGRAETVAAGYLGNTPDDEEGRPKTIAASNKEETEASAAKRVPATSAKGKEDSNIKDEGFGLPDFLRFIIIAAIIIAIVIFFGGQIMQYQNSQNE